MDSVGARLKALRESLKISQKELGTRLGTTQSAINRYENNQSEAPYKTLLLYADIFDVSMDYIFGRTDNPRGKLFDCKSQYVEDNKELKLFVEMCFDPNSPVNARLKETLIKLLEGKSDES